MPYAVRLLAAAERDLKTLAKKLTKAKRKQLTGALREMEVDPRAGDTIPLVGTKDLWRRRVGDYRIVFTIRDRALLIVVVLIGDRKDVYAILDRRDLTVLGLTDTELLSALTQK